MYILSQDEKILINTDNTTIKVLKNIGGGKDKKFIIVADTFDNILGSYATEEEAIQILKEIAFTIEKNQVRLYQVPKKTTI